jgi:hypothetical protein
MSKEKEYTRKLQRIIAAMKKIEEKYPHVDFTDSTLRQSVSDYGQLMRSHTYTSVNIDYCSSADPDRMCETCNCWKQARATTM